MHPWHDIYVDDHIIGAVFPVDHRSADGQQEQVRARQGIGPAAARPRPLQRRLLPGQLRLHSAHLLRRRRSARRAGAGPGAGPSADRGRRARHRRDAHARREGHRRQDHRGQRPRSGLRPTTPTTPSCRRTRCARSAASSRTTRRSRTSRWWSRTSWAPTKRCACSRKRSSCTGNCGAAKSIAASRDSAGFGSNGPHRPGHARRLEPAAPGASGCAGRRSQKLSPAARAELAAGAARAFAAPATGGGTALVQLLGHKGDLLRHPRPRRLRRAGPGAARPGLRRRCSSTSSRRCPTCRSSSSACTR